MVLLLLELSTCHLWQCPKYTILFGRMASLSWQIKRYFFLKFNMWKFSYDYVFWLAQTQPVQESFRNIFFMILSCIAVLQSLKIFGINRVIFWSRHCDPYINPQLHNLILCSCHSQLQLLLEVLVKGVGWYLSCLGPHIV